MELMTEVLLTVVSAFAPILAACLIGAIAWTIKHTRRTDRGQL